MFCECWRWLRNVLLLTSPWLLLVSWCVNVKLVWKLVGEFEQHWDEHDTWKEKEIQNTIQIFDKPNNLQAWQLEVKTRVYRKDLICACNCLFVFVLSTIYLAKYMIMPIIICLLLSNHVIKYILIVSKRYFIFSISNIESNKKLSKYSSSIN